MNIKKNGFSMLDVVFGFVLLGIIVLFTIVTMTNSFKNLVKGRQLTENIFGRSKTLQDGMIEVRKKVENGDTIADDTVMEFKDVTTDGKEVIRKYIVNKKNYTLFNGADSTPVEVYQLKYDETDPDFRREYKLLVTSKVLEDLPFVKVKDVKQTIGKFSDWSQQQVNDGVNRINWYQPDLIMNGDWQVDDSIDPNKPDRPLAIPVPKGEERRYWQIATSNFIIPVYEGVEGSEKYEENLLGLAYPIPRIDTQQFPIPINKYNTDIKLEYANRVIYYTVTTLSSKGKLGPYEWPKDGSIFLFRPPGGITPSFHLEANFIHPKNYSKNGNVFDVSRVNKPIEPDTSIPKSGNISLTTEKSGNSGKDIYTRAFAFKGSSFIQSSFSGTNITMIVVAKVDSDPNAQAPIIFLGNNSTDFKIKLNSKNVQFKSGTETTLDLVPMPEQNSYAVYTVKIKQDGTASVQVNNKNAVVTNPKLNSSPINGNIKIGFIDGSSILGDVNIAEVLVYNNASFAEPNSTDANTIIQELISKYGIK